MGLIHQNLLQRLCFHLVIFDTRLLFTLQKIYDVGADHASFHAQLELADNPSDCFDHFRKSYPQRDEISYDR